MGVVVFSVFRGGRGAMSFFICGSLRALGGRGPITTNTRTLPPKGLFVHLEEFLFFTIRFSLYF